MRALQRYFSKIYFRIHKGAEKAGFSEFKHRINLQVKHLSCCRMNVLRLNRAYPKESEAVHFQIGDCQ